jgi:magnesium transporter
LRAGGYLAVVFRILVTGPGEPAVRDAAVEELPALLARPDARIWVDVTAPIGEVETAIVRDVFKFHPLAIEDCFERRAHPKIDEYDRYLYIITHGLSAGATAESAQPVELDAFLGPNFLVTHHADASRSVAAVMEQVTRTGIPLKQGPTAVLHAILDRQVDGLELVLDNIEARIETLEDAVFVRPRNAQIASLLSVKRNILELRRWTAKQREVLLRLGRREFALISAEDTLLFRDVHDHLVRINDLLEGFRDMLTSIQEAYLSVVSNRTNDIMRFLTLFSTVMLPLTVVTGIYGMNFDHMPELRSKHGYPLVLVAMLVIAGSMLLYFRHRGWLGRPPPAEENGEESADTAPRRGDRPRRTASHREAARP